MQNLPLSVQFMSKIGRDLCLIIDINRLISMQVIQMFIVNVKIISHPTLYSYFKNINSIIGFLLLIRKVNGTNIYRQCHKIILHKSL